MIRHIVIQLQLAFAGVRNAILRRTRGQITRGHVIWAYRLFLDREPENRQVIKEKLAAWRLTSELRRDLMSSEEFRLHNAGLSTVDKSRPVIVELDSGARLFVNLDDVTIGRAIVSGAYEPSELAFALDSVRPGDLALDIGAHIGFFAVQLARAAGLGGRVIAFEPVAANAGLLAKSIVENGLSDVLQLQRAAVGNITGSASLVVRPDSLNSGGAHLQSSGGKVPPHHEARAVPMVRLDDLKLPSPVRFIKMDVEGAEMLCLQGGRELLARDRPLILSELCSPQLAAVSGCTSGEFISAFEALDYACHLLQNGKAGRRIKYVVDDDLHSVVFLPVR